MYKSTSAAQSVARGVDTAIPMITMVSISIHERKNRSWGVRKKPPKEVKQKDPVSPFKPDVKEEKKCKEKKQSLSGSEYLHKKKSPREGEKQIPCRADICFHYAVLTTFRYPLILPIQRFTRR